MCHKVQVETHLLTPEGEILRLRTAIAGDDARLDTKASGFWQRCQTAFFDVRVTHANAPSHVGVPIKEVLKRQEDEKKRSYLESIVKVENGSFTPLVSARDRAVGKECGILSPT